MPLPIAIPIVLGAISLISGMMKKHSTQTGTTSTAPAWGDEFQGLKGKLIDSASRNLSGGGSYSMARNITNQNLQGINQGANAAQTGLAARLAAMGINGGAAAAPMATLDASRFGSLVGTMNQQPLLQHGFDVDNFNQAMGVLGLGRGSTGTMKSDMATGGGLGGGLEGVGSMLGLLYGQGGMGGGGGQAPMTMPSSSFFANLSNPYLHP